MSAYLNPEKIYSDFTNESISKNAAINLLITLIENNDFYMRRIEGLELIEKIGLRTEELFKILENWVVSDEMQVIRAITLKVMIKLYPNKSLDILPWLLNTIKNGYEYKSHFMFAMLIDLLYWSEDEYMQGFKDKLIKKLKPIVRNYIHEGVIQNEAVFLALLEVQSGSSKINKIELNEDGDYCQDGSNEFLFYRINEAGHIINIKIKGNIFFIPNYLYKLNYLQGLELSGNFITLIPESLCYLESLKALDLSWNHIKNIPKSIGSLSNLRKLNLTHNQIYKIPESFKLLTSLKELYLGHNQLNMIPENISLLKDLEVLHLYENGLNKIPDSIGALSSLRVLDLWNNNIQILPESMANLHLLEILNLGHNKVQNIPNSINSLQSIQQIDLRFNEIRELPECLLSPDWLKKLDLEGNKIKNVITSKY